MAESLESFKSYIGKSETANDVVTASMLVNPGRDVGIGESAAGKGLTDSARLVRELLPRVAPTRQDAHGRAGLGWRHRAADSVAAPAHRRDARFVSCTALRRGRRQRAKPKLAISRSTRVPRARWQQSWNVRVSRQGAAFAWSKSEIRACSASNAPKPRRNRRPPSPEKRNGNKSSNPMRRCSFVSRLIRFNSHRIHYDRDYVTKVGKTPWLGRTELADLAVAHGDVPQGTAESPHDELRFSESALGVRYQRQGYPRGSTVGRRPRSQALGIGWRRQAFDAGDRKIRIDKFSRRAAYVGAGLKPRPHNHNIIEIFRQLLEHFSMARIVRIELLSRAVIRLDHRHARPYVVRNGF